LPLARPVSRLGTRLPQEAAAARAEAAVFDASRLTDFTEKVVLNAPATALSPLVHEAGRLVRAPLPL